MSPEPRAIGRTYPQPPGEVLNLLENWWWGAVLLEGLRPPPPVAAGGSREHRMEKRVPPSMRTRQALSELIEGRLGSPDGRAELVKLATRLIVEEALEAECRDALDRDYYERGAEPGRGYRNGVRAGRLKTAEGLIDYAAPQVAGR
jgi:hypothetical protein